MATTNPITGDTLISKVNTKAFEDNFDRIFRKKPQSLDAAYERRAMEEGLVTEPVFDENIDWQSEQRAKAIAQNGNVGYTDDDLQK